MKHLLKLFLITILVFTSCNKDDQSISETTEDGETEKTEEVSRKEEVALRAVGSSFCGPYTISEPIKLSGVDGMTISGLEISNPDGHCIELNNCHNIIIENCKLGASLMNGVNLFNCTNITIRQSSMHTVATGVYAQECKEISVTNIDVTNVQGPFPRGQMVQFNNVSGAGNEVNFNWQANGDFVAGLQTVTAGGVVMKAALAQEPRDRATICNMQPTGDFAKWRAAMDVFNHPGQEHAQLAICGAYASPLMVFSAIQGFIVSLHGVTGSGKTAIQRASASVWGEPRKQLFTAPNTSGGDTMLSVIRAIGTGRHLPVNMEEITNMPAEKMSDFVHAMTLGSEKSRLKSTQNGEYARSVGMQWETVMIASSNETIRDKLNSAKYDAVAESMRVFELRHIPLVKGTDVVRDTVRLKDLNSHYGHGGTIYARFLQSNREKLEGWINKRVEWITEKVHATQDERFWVQGMAVWLVGIELSRAAGLHSFDVPNLERYIIAQFLDQRAQVTMVKEHSSTSFSEMVNDLLPRAVILDRNTNSAQGELKSIYPKSGRLAMRVEIHNGVGYLSTSAVRDWALMKNIPHSALLENGVSGGYLAAVDDTAKTARKVLSKGVKGLTGGGQIRCYKFKVPDEELYSIKNHMVANTEENEDEPE